MFIPFGLLCPVVFKRTRAWWKTVLTAFGTSFLIEFIQYFIGRSCDIDDLIMNTLGACIGYAAFVLCSKAISKKHPLIKRAAKPNLRSAPRNGLIYAYNKTLRTLWCIRRVIYCRLWLTHEGVTSRYAPHLRFRESCRVPCGYAPKQNSFAKAFFLSSEK